MPDAVHPPVMRTPYGIVITDGKMKARHTEEFKLEAARLALPGAGSDACPALRRCMGGCGAAVGCGD